MYIYQISLSTMGFVAQVSEMKRLVKRGDKCVNPRKMCKH